MNIFKNLCFWKRNEPILPKNSTGSKYALVFGISDYPDGIQDLKGCANDVANVSLFLKDQYKFNVTNMMNDSCTIQNVTSAIGSMFSQIRYGDSAVIYYSGHGSTIADKDGDEEDGRDETWYLYDGHMADDILRGLVKNFHSEANLTVISDSCHSATITRSFLNTVYGQNEDYYAVAKYVPPQDDVDAALLSAMPVKKAIFNPEKDMNHILISGCQANEFSYDTKIDGNYTGAFTYYLLQILRKDPNITYNDFYKQIRVHLPSFKYPQTPSLEGRELTKDNRFFC